MKAHHSRNSLKKPHALSFIPQKNEQVQEEILPNGDIILIYQVVYQPFFLKIKRLIGSNKGTSFTKKLQLDGLGVHVWSLMDGKKNVKFIIKEFARHHRLNQREAEVSVTLFLKSLGERGLIGMKEP